ncbi:enoyl-CoA hydratase/isomerase family protein [Streptacidiphilus sp. PAMC 29251]
MTEEAGVTYAVEGPIARITLARPQASNAFDLPAARALAAAVRRAADDPVGAVLITAQGKRFCGGGDVASIAGAQDRGGHIHALATELGEALQSLTELEKPVVAAVHGAVAGAGLAVLLSSDLVVADRSTRFLMAYAGVGLTPDCGVSYLLPRAVGQQRALELALTPRVLSAAEAHEWGLVAQVVDDGTAQQSAQDLAVRLAAGPTFALAQTKRLIRSSWEVSRPDSLRDESDTIARAVTSESATVLIDAFTAGPPAAARPR